MNFDYFYGKKHEQYNFFQIPKLLITDDCFSELTMDAKVLYSLMLDRCGLSVSNGWKDETGRVYIVYKLDNIMSDFHCANQKATKLLRELENFGLIERKKQGFGKAPIIYIKNFASCLDFLTNDNHENHEPHSRDDQDTSHENHESHNHDDQDASHENHESHNHDDQDVSHENHDSRVMNNMIIDSWKSHTNNTNNHNTELSNTNSINQSKNIDKDSNSTSYVRDSDRWKEYYENLRLKISGQINLVELLLHCKNDLEKNHVMEIYEMIVEVFDEVEPTIRIGKIERPIQQVQERFSKLTYEHIQYVLDCLEHNNNGDIYNIRNYMLTSLYNSITSIQSYYTSKFNYVNNYGTFYREK